MLNSGITPVVMDNLYNANKEALKRVEELTGKTIEFVELDLQSMTLAPSSISPGTKQWVNPSPCQLSTTVTI
jgi:UDP-glucose 4-epimerase